MGEVPYLTNTETEESAFPTIGQGGSDVALLMGRTTGAADLDTIHEFYSYYDALNQLGPEAVGNELLNAIKNMFIEGGRYQSYQNPTISKVYAIEMGVDPTGAEFEIAMENSLIKKDIDFEVYLNNFDVSNFLSHMNAVASHLSDLEDANDYRQAVFTLDPTMSVSEKVALTDTTELAYIHDNRVILYDNPDLQAKYVAKVCCTPYDIDPARDAYRTVAPSEINEYTFADMERLVGAGITIDYRTPSLSKALSDTVTPVRSVSSAHALSNGRRGLATDTHVRRNVDYQWWKTDILALAELKQNNTDIAREHLLSVISSHFESEVQRGAIVPQTAAPEDRGYFVDVIPDVEDPNKIHVLRKIRPVNAIYFIEIESVIHAPAQQAIDQQRMKNW